METLPPNQDVDMDAPQISILKEESPPPPPRRVKLLVKDTRGTATQASSSSSRKRARSDDEEEEEEDEEDQLIDDDDDVVPPTGVPPVVIPSAPVAAAADSVSAKRKTPSKRKPKKSEKKQAEEERQSAQKLMQAGGAQNLAPTVTWFEVSPAKPHEQAGRMGTLDVGPPSAPAAAPLNIVSLDPGPSKAPPKKKAAVGKKPQAVPRPRAKPGPKPKTAVAALQATPPDDTTDVVSEAGYTVTAASSPVTAHFENNTPEPEPLPPATGTPGGPAVDDPPINLQEVPLPQYPLPVKPFAVMPPPKAASGFAPSLPLDRTGAKVRHWRVVNREIRGIAGGRWFTRTWVGAKESSFALTIASGTGEKQASSSVVLPKLPAMSISTAGSKPAKGKAAAKNAAASLNASTAPSRSSSAVPSKMRTIMLAPPSDGGDSDMVAAPET